MIIPSIKLRFIPVYHSEILFLLLKVPLTTNALTRTFTDTTNAGAYILSPLEEASRDPMQNAGFVVKWINTNQTTRVTSYSLRNSLDLSSPPASPAPTKSSFSARPLIRASSSFIRRSIDSAAQQQPASPPPLTSRTLPSSAKKGPVLSKILSDATAGAGGPTTYAAFKTLPVDPTRARRGSDYSEPADDLTGAATCKEAVDIMVDAIRRACEDLGNVHPDIVTDGDVVRSVDVHYVIFLMILDADVGSTLAY